MVQSLHILQAVIARLRMEKEARLVKHYKRLCNTARFRLVWNISCSNHMYTKDEKKVYNVCTVMCT